VTTVWHQTPDSEPDLRAAIRAQAHALGFDAVGFAAPDLPRHLQAAYRQYIAERREGDMAWLARHPKRRQNPRGLWPEVKSVIVLGMNYGPDDDPLANLARRDRATISVYARHRDYHDLIKGRLKQLADHLHRDLGAAVKVFVDTAPVLEKPLAQQAAIGWQGKHSNLVSRTFGSWLFLGEIFCDLALEPDQPEVDHCGSCRACLDVCPTDAFPAPYQLDARRCISYLTIEHKGHIPEEFREAIGNRIYGCDDCLAVCPWNKFARVASETRLQARDDLRAPALAELGQLDDATFRSRFAGSPIKRTGRDRFVRNVLIAIGNSGEPALAEIARARLADPSPLVRAMAVWALHRLLEPGALASLAKKHAPGEPDDAVAREWRRAS
jgi:epoxyqueuosine reductase